jgi:hypothetical protein
MIGEEMRISVLVFARGKQEQAIERLIPDFGNRPRGRVCLFFAKRSWTRRICGQGADLALRKISF